MKVTSYGYNKGTQKGYIEYTPSFIERLFGVHPKREEWKLRTDKEWHNYSGGVWVHLQTGEVERNHYLDCAKNLTEI